MRSRQALNHTTAFPSQSASTGTHETTPTAPRLLYREGAVVRLRWTLFDFLWASLGLNCPGVNPLLSWAAQIRARSHLCHLQVGGAIQGHQTQSGAQVQQLCLNDPTAGIPGQKPRPVYLTVRHKLETLSGYIGPQLMSDASLKPSDGQ